MCSRFAIKSPIETFAARFQVPAARQMVANYDIAPRYSRVEIACQPRDSYAQWRVMDWGLKPHWIDPAKNTTRPIHARVETVHTSAYFRRVFRYRRGLVPANGWFEWRDGPAGKEKWYFQLPDAEPFGFAGLWDRWNHPGTGDGINSEETFAIITTAANKRVSKVHDRMPVIVRAEDYAAWFSPAVVDATAALEMLKSRAGNRIECWRVNPRPRSGAKGPELIEPVDKGDL